VSGSSMARRFYEFVRFLAMNLVFLLKGLL
jgi:hypothetical protein